MDKCLKNMNFFEIQKKKFKKILDNFEKNIGKFREIFREPKFLRIKFEIFQKKNSENFREL